MNNRILAYELYKNLYLNITNRCTAECIFCKKREVNVYSEKLTSLDDIIFGYNSNGPVYGRDLRLKEEPSVDDIINEIGNDFSRYDEVVFTGLGEPLIRLNEVLEVTKQLTFKGISVRLDTIGNAKILYPERNIAKELAHSGMKKVSISLNAHNEEIFNKICRPKLKNSYISRFEFANDIIKFGMGLRFTVVNLPDVDIDICSQIARKYNAEFEVRTLF